MAEKKVSWTDEQKKVITSRDRSMLVSAAAGSGKTAVLVERIIRLITDEEEPVDVDRFLVVTFTKAAAAQMKEKIRKALSDRLEENPSDANLQRQAALIHNAHVMTIDAFCQYVLKNAVAEGEADPGFRMADEAENKLLEADVLDEFIEELYAESDPDFVYMADHLVAGSDDAGLNDAISSMHDKASSGPWPGEWLDERAGDYSCPGDELPAAVRQYVYDRMLVLAENAAESYRKALDAAEEGGLTDKNVNLIIAEGETSRVILERLGDKTSFDGETYDAVRDMAAAVTFDRFDSRKGEGEDPACRQAAMNCRNAGKKDIQGLCAGVFESSYVNLIAHAQNCDRVLRTLCGITRRYMDKVAKAKRDKKIMSFADCEHQTLNLLVRHTGPGTYEHTDVAREFRKYFSYVFIDEYQDSNLVQELILSAVSREEEGTYNRFMVGDVKQSIYMFRQAEPQIFIDKHHEYGYDDPCRIKIDLNRNFRSRKEVIDSVNALFERIMTESSGGSEYDEAAALKQGASFPEATGDEYVTEMIFVEKPMGDELEDAEKDRLEGEAMAARIKELMDGGFRVRDEENEGETRPLRYSDIVILYRSGKEYATTYKKVLEERGIPAHLTGSKGYFATYEISTLMNLLRVLVNPLQDTYFYGVMESVIGGFSPEEIARISVHYRHDLPDGVPLGDGYLYGACRHAADGDAQIPDEGLRTRIRTFLKMMDDYREASEYLSVESLLTRILRETGYRSFVAAMHGGTRREANLDMLIRKASDYANTSYFGLYNFIRYVETLRQADAMDSEAEVAGESADVVRIMTTHKSKGLEFPVCFVARMGNRFNLQDSRKNLIIDHDAGIGMKDRDVRRRLEYDTIIRRYVSDVINSKTIAEEMRILYVAMTRAREKLILVGTGLGRSDVDAPGTAYVKKPESIQKYADWHLQCLCDELGEDELVLTHEREKIDPLHVTVALADLSDENLADQRVSEAMESNLRRAFLDSDAMSLPEDDPYLVRLRELLDETYPHVSLKGLYAKTSVSEIKESAIIEQQEAANEMYPRVAAVPRFISGRMDTNKATVRGSAYHRVMELAVFSELCKQKDLMPGLLDAHLASHKITSFQRDIFRAKDELECLEGFFDSPLAARMAAAEAAGELRRESPFMMGIGANMVDPDYPAEETVLIQGIIDAWWIEDGEAVILDYKTDRSRDPEYYVSHYGTQLDLYEEALEKMRISVREKLIYSFEMQNIIKI